MLTLLTLVALVATAQASPLAAVLFPAATIPDAREVSVEGYALAATSTVCDTSYPSSCSDGTTLVGGPALRAQVPLHPRVGVDLRGGMLRANGTSSFFGMVTVKGSVVATPAIHVTPWASAVRLIDEGVIGIAGLSVDAGGDRVRADMSVPVGVALFTDGDVEVVPPYIPPAFSELGVRYRVNEHHTVRLGTLSVVAPGVGWQGTFGPTTIEAALHLAPAQTPYARLAITRAM
jgi:hypothetical protein